DYEPSVAAPAGVARAYAHVVRFPRALLVVLLALPRIALVVALRRRRPGRRLAEIALLSGGGVALIAGATLTSAFVVRYMVPPRPALVARVFAPSTCPRGARRWRGVGGGVGGTSPGARPPPRMARQPVVRQRI